MDDQEWLCRKPWTPQLLRLIRGPAGVAETVLPGLTAIKTGGHFPGSLVLHWEKKLFIADTIVTVPVSNTPFSASASIPCHMLLLKDLVCIYTPSSPPRPDKLLFPMVNPKPDPAATIRNTQDMARG